MAFHFGIGVWLWEALEEIGEPTDLLVVRAAFYLSAAFIEGLLLGASIGWLIHRRIRSATTDIVLALHDRIEQLERQTDNPNAPTPSECSDSRTTSQEENHVTTET